MSEKLAVVAIHESYGSFFNSIGRAVPQVDDVGMILPRCRSPPRRASLATGAGGLLQTVHSVSSPCKISDYGAPLAKGPG